MIVIRRELPQSSAVGQHEIVRHIAISRMLLTVASPPGPAHSRQSSRMDVYATCIVEYSRAIAQTNPANSRATATMATCRSLLRWTRRQNLR